MTKIVPYYMKNLLQGNVKGRFTCPLILKPGSRLATEIDKIITHSSRACMALFSVLTERLESGGGGGRKNLAQFNQRTGVYGGVSYSLPVNPLHDVLCR